MHPLIAVLLLDRMTDPTEEGGQSHPVCHPAPIPQGNERFELIRKVLTLSYTGRRAGVPRYEAVVLRRL